MVIPGAPILCVQSASPGRNQSSFEGESVAREAVSKKDTSLATVLRALQGSHIPFSTSRKNVIPEGQEGIHGMVLGLFVFGANIGCSAATEERPWLARLLSDYAHEKLPDFPFTSIQVNKVVGTARGHPRTCFGSLLKFAGSQHVMMHHAIWHLTSNILDV